MFPPSVKKVLPGEMARAENLPGFVECTPNLLQRNAMIQEPFHEEQVHEVQEGRV